MVFSFADSNARSQNFIIDWFTIDGGGGATSAGGGFAVSGTIGQADAGRLSGGNYTLDGGFWGIIADSPLPTLRLTIELLNRTVRVCLPAPSTGFVIQSSDSLSMPIWMDVLQTPSDSGATRCVTLPAAPGTMFFD